MTQSSLKKGNASGPSQVQQSSRQGGDGRYAVQLRGMSFEEGADLLRPKEGEGAGEDPPVQLKKSVQAKMPAPGAKSRMSIGSSYKKIYDLEKKVGKAKAGAKKEKLVKELLQRVERYLATHTGLKNSKERERVLAVQKLLQQLKPDVVEETTSETTPVPPTETTKSQTEGPTETTTTDGPTEIPTETKTDTPSETKTETTTEPLPQQVTDENVGQVLGDLGLPVVDLGGETGKTTTETTTEPKGEGTTTTEVPKTEETSKVPDAPAPDLPKSYGTLPKGVTDKDFGDPSVLLTVDQISALNYGQLIHYLDTRDKTHVESLRTEGKFVSAVMKNTSVEIANIVVRIILRCPGTVVDRGGAREEAIRILTSQLRSPAIAKKLLQGDVLVVIVPKNALMTDLPEFAAQRGQYTFDGRPWDTTRGLGGQNTAIAEENLMGSDVSSESHMTRKGWANQAEYDDDTSKGVDTHKTTDFNPGVYCSGYSTTNHEFFHTIHSYGLSKADSDAIWKLYNAKKSLPRTVEWADGPRQLQDGTDSENYSSSTHYEYFAQTGCAYQGTNVGTDPYTSRPRNNGKKWVEDNEPGLASLYAKTCDSEELKRVNPREAYLAREKIKAGKSGEDGQKRATTGIDANPELKKSKEELQKKLSPPQNPPGLLVDK